MQTGLNSKSFPPKKMLNSSYLRGLVETAGIEPASAVA